MLILVTKAAIGLAQRIKTKQNKKIKSEQKFTAYKGNVEARNTCII